MKNTHFSLTVIIAAAAIFVILSLIHFLGISFPVTVINTNRSTELSVIGEGKVEVVPDNAYVDLGITVNNAATVEAAQKEINTINNAIVAAMAKLGIQKKDIKTSNYSIYPNYSYSGDVSSITGYNGNVSIKVKVTDPQKAAEVIAQGTTAGANQVNGTQFTVADPDKYRAEARSKAIQNAKEQAEKLAKDLNIKLGKIVNIVEYSPDSGVVMPQYTMSEKVGLGGGSTPNISQGSQTITSVVTLYFEKK